LLRLYHIDKDGTRQYLVEETFGRLSDGRERAAVARLPGAKKLAHESARAGAARILTDILKIDPSNAKTSNGDREVFEEAAESFSYPGVQTFYQNEIIEVSIDATTAGCLVNRGSITGDHASRKEYAWRDEKTCKATDVRIRAPEKGTEFSGIVHPPIGYKEDELAPYLEEHGIKIDLFGTGKAASLKDFADELSRGECHLTLRNNKLERIVDVVLLKLYKQGTEEVLVEHTDASSIRLIGLKRRPDESHFLTAQKIIRTTLKLDENHCRIDPEGVRVHDVVKESDAYPGVLTLYRKRIITCMLLDESSSTMQ